MFYLYVICIVVLPVCDLELAGVGWVLCRLLFFFAALAFVERR